LNTNGSSGDGSNGLTFDLQNLLPGVPQSVTVAFNNDGLSAQDVYLVLGTGHLTDLATFTALYGSVKITRGDTTVLWNSPYWGAFPSTGNLLIRSNVGALTGGGTFTVTFEIYSTLTAGGGTSLASPIPFTIVATQVGILPGA